MICKTCGQEIRREKKSYETEYTYECDCTIYAIVPTHVVSLSAFGGKKNVR